MAIYIHAIIILVYPILFFVATVHNRGWMIGPELGGSVLNIHTRSVADCPVGILSAYDRDETLDSSFRIACHSDAVVTPCCASLTVTAETVTGEGNETLRGSIAERQELLLGDYEAVGELNGRPVYSHEVFGITTYLTFRKQGERPPDSRSFCSLNVRLFMDKLIANKAV